MVVLGQQGIKAGIMHIWISLCFFIMTVVCVHSGQQSVPRFVSLRSKAVNMHVGPGVDYRTIWQYVKPGYPLEVIAEFGPWRRVRDVDGVTGWIHKGLLSSKRMGLIQKKTDLYQEPHESSPIKAHVSPGVVMKILNFLGDWCRVEIAHNGRVYMGWMQKNTIWGVHTKEQKLL